MTRSYWTPAVVVVVAGLVLLLASAAGWVTQEESRPVGEIVVVEESSVSGATFAPTAVVFGLAALLGGILLGVLRGGPRRIVAVGCLAVGLAGVTVVVQGLSRAAASNDPTTPAPVFAAVAALTVAVGAGLAARGPVAPPKASRYRVEAERPEDEEWNVASEESP